MTGTSDRPVEDRARRRLSPFHLFTFTAFAVAQPLYDLLARHPEFLIAHRLGGGALLVLIAFLSLLLPGVPALLLWALERFAPRLAGAVVAALTAVTIGLALLAPAHRHVSLPAWATVAAVALAASWLTWCAFRYKLARTFVLFLAPASVLFPALFLLHPAIRPLVVRPAVEVAAADSLRTTPPIVIVVFDELPLASLLDADLDVDGDRFPAFAELAARSHWFENATTVAAQTEYAVPAILTGRLPEPGRSITAAEHPRSVFSWLGGAYRMAVFETFTEICPESLCAAGEPFGESPLRSTLADLAIVYLHHALPETWSERLPPVDHTWRDFADPRGRGDRPPAAVTERRGDIPRVFERFVASFAADEPPTLHFVHLNLPHVPWKYLPSGKEYGPIGLSKSEESVPNQWQEREWPTVQALQRHLLQLGYADRLLGELIDHLESLGLYDSALFVVIADHGASFRPGTARRAITPGSAVDVMRVPFFIKEPGQLDATRSPRNVEIIDLLPTLADLLGVELPWPVDGVSALGPQPHPRAGRKAYVSPKESSAESLRFVEALPGPESTVRRQIALFGTGGDGSLFRIGPHRELLGRPVSPRLVARRSRWTVELKESHRFADLDLAGAYLPARVFGLLGGSERPGPVAIALNGTIAATTEPEANPRGGWHVTAMLPEEALLQGFNQLDVYEVLGAGSELRLAPIATTAPPAARLVRNRHGAPRRLVYDGGRELRVRRSSKRFRGEVWTNGVAFVGYAVDLDLMQAADEVLVFLENRLVTRFRVAERSRFKPRVTAGIDRPDFKGPVPYGVLGSRDLSELTFIAVTENVGFLLRSHIHPTPDAAPERGEKP